MNHPTPMRAAPLLLSLLALAGCGKVQDAVSEKAAEKVAEAMINKDGGNAQVDIHENGMKVQGTDEKGQSFQMEMGAAPVDEKALGLPFYPGARPVADKSNHMVVGDQELYQVELHSGDAPRKVADWYRSQLKSGTPTDGKLVMDQSEGQGMALSITDPKSEATVMVDVKPGDDGQGSVISLTHGFKRAGRPG